MQRYVVEMPHLDMRLQKPIIMGITIFKFYLGRYINEYTVGNHVLWLGSRVNVKLSFQPYIQQYTSQNEKFDYSYRLNHSCSRSVKLGMTFHVNCLLTDDSHVISILIWFLKVVTKIVFLMTESLSWYSKRFWSEHSLNLMEKIWYIENIRWVSFDIKFTRQGFEKLVNIGRLAERFNMRSQSRVC